LGIGHAWVFDHHSWRTLRDRTWYDSLTLLTAVAGITDRIRLGTMVTTPNFRHPVVLAKQVMTLDEVSGGRFVFGVGAGAAGPDALLLGGPELSGQDRATRFAEFVELSDLLLRNQVTNYAGQHFTAVDARMIPGCVQRPRVPLAIAASGSRGLAVVGLRADGGDLEGSCPAVREMQQCVDRVRDVAPIVVFDLDAEHRTDDCEGRFLFRALVVHTVESRTAVHS
jgi:alkanesulfonate monooxygenase SsuD/methylene tetrahydromethanopterin reductase-like flavin-dependent oxidoreductase (luciferase family)